MKKKELLLKKTIEEVYILLKDNDLITIKFKEKGSNVTQYRDYIKRSKDIVDKIQQQSKNMNEIFFKNSLLKLEEIKVGNQKIKEKLSSKIKAIKVKKGNNTIQVDPPQQKRTSLFPSEEEVQRLADQQYQEEVEQNLQRKKRTIQERTNTLIQNQSGSLPVCNRTKETKLYWMTAVKQGEASLRNYEKILYDLQVQQYEQILNKKAEEPYPIPYTDQLMTFFQDLQRVLPKQENQQKLEQEFVQKLHKLKIRNNTSLNMMNKILSKYIQLY